MLVYRGEATDMSEMSEEQSQEVMGEWATCLEGGVGSNLEDIGSPFGPSVSMVDDGSDGQAASLTGYRIVEANNIAGARSLAQGHPYLSEGQGNFAIDIHEVLPVPEIRSEARPHRDASVRRS